jgi:hypothetical protein
MNLQTSLDNLGYSNLSLITDAELRTVVNTILAAESMNAAERDTLRCLYNNGPVWDGDLPSKTGRDELVKKGFAVRVIVKRGPGYNACTPLGAEALQIRGLDTDV